MDEDRYLLMMFMIVLILLVDFLSFCLIRQPSTTMNRMAPEVILCETIKDSPYDFRADIWSFG